MPVGTVVRRALGRFEPAAIRAYRGAFIDLAELAVTIASVVPDTRRVLEIGCGDGAMAAAQRRALPDAAILGVDPGVAEPGRMFDADRDGVEFGKATSSELLADGAGRFDLVVLVDVLHHVADGQREQVLRDAAALTAPGGVVAVKEWDRRGGVGTVVAYVADRYVSGDSTVRFMPRAELDGLVAGAMPGWRTVCECRVPPRKANLLLMLRRP
jgi:2-polyprenyl-6-hydroxyphenyl methylase/3-demethylubiquinone-9 3-methyltransferase